jgi:hypothetical protein
MVQGVANEVMNLASEGVISARDIMRIANRHIPTDEKAKPVRYEISTMKAAKRLLLPKTDETVTAFIESLASGKS